MQLKANLESNLTPSLTHRMCVACRSILPIDQLWRFTWRKDGFVLFDQNRYLEGRGAYICQNQQCLDRAIHKKALARAFKKPILGISMPVN